MRHADIAQETYGDDLGGLVRYLKFMLKQAHKQIGKQGETIHHLRGEIAEVRLLSSRIERGDLRAYERKTEALTTQVNLLRADNRVLREKLRGEA